MPHRGWSLVDVEDLGEAAHTCHACEYEPIRYVHHLTHEEWAGELLVGCVCSEHLTCDYVTPRQMEKKARRLAAARKRWIQRRWKISAKGNLWVKLKGHHMSVFPLKSGTGWKCTLDGRFGQLVHATREAAMLSLFNKLTIEQPWVLTRGDPNT
jgi:hypothetical protein